MRKFWSLAALVAMVLSLLVPMSASAASGSFTATAFRGCDDNSVNLSFTGDAIPVYGEVSLHNTSDDTSTGFTAFSPAAGVSYPVDFNWDVVYVEIPGLDSPISLHVGNCGDEGTASVTIEVGEEPGIKVWDVTFVALQCNGTFDVRISHPETVQDGEIIYWYIDQGDQRITQGGDFSQQGSDRLLWRCRCVAGVG